MVNSIIAFYPTQTAASRWWQLAGNAALVVVLFIVVAISELKVAKGNVRLTDYARSKERLAAK